MSKLPVQRIGYFMLAIFLLVTSLGAVWLVFLQTKNAQTSNPTASNAQDQIDAAKCTVPDSLKSQTPTSPEEVYKITTEPSELETTDIKVGDGQEAKLGDCIVINYRLNMADGSIVENNDTFTSGSPVAFPLKEGSLIEGWTKGVPGMKVGGIRRLVIPAKYAYGETGQCTSYDSATSTCQAYSIPPNAPLVFDIELLDIQ